MLGRRGKESVTHYISAHIATQHEKCSNRQIGINAIRPVTHRALSDDSGTIGS